MLSNLDVKYFKLAVGNDRIKHETDVDISARCPICGDSAHSQSKARLHLYEKNSKTFVNCFNGGCPCHNTTVYSFLKRFYPELFTQYKKEIARSNIANIEPQDVFASLADSDKNETVNITNSSATNIVIPPELVTFDFSNYFMPYDKSSKYLHYVESRGINKHYDWYFSTKNLEVGNKFLRLKDNLIIPFYSSKSEWYGFYSRNIYEKKFTTYMPEANTGYKLWNWFGIDKSKPVYIFEGIFDALSAIESGLTNCIACCGAKLSDARLGELKKPVFCLDNDTTGLKNMLNYAKKGYSCYIPSFNNKDMNEYLLSGGNCKEEILTHTYPGVVAQVKICAKL